LGKECFRKELSELPDGEIVGSPRRVVFLKELMEPPSRDKVNEWV
jgi:hypothetical protein